MFLLQYAGVIVGAALLYWFSKLISDKPTRIFFLVPAFAVAFVAADNYLKFLLQSTAGRPMDNLTSFASGLVLETVLALLVGSAALYMLAMNEENLETWLLTYVGSLIVLLFL